MRRRCPRSSRSRQSTTRWISTASTRTTSIGSAGTGSQRPTSRTRPTGTPVGSLARRSTTSELSHPFAPLPLPLRLPSRPPALHFPLLSPSRLILPPPASLCGRAQHTLAAAITTAQHRLTVASLRRTTRIRKAKELWPAIANKVARCDTHTLSLSPVLPRPTCGRHVPAFAGAQDGGELTDLVRRARQVRGTDWLPGLRRLGHAGLPCVTPPLRGSETPLIAPRPRSPTSAFLTPPAPCAGWPFIAGQLDSPLMR